MLGTGMSTDRHWRELCLRAAFALSGCAVLAWGAIVFPHLIARTSAAGVADRILSDDRLRAGALTEVLSGVNAPSHAVISPSGLQRARAILMLRDSEEALDRGDVANADRKTTAAYDAVKASLGLTPADSFLWLMLFALENDRNGFAPSNLDLLKESYATGPLEGWISLRRNRLALAVFPSLDAGTQDSVVAEFAAMVDSGFIDAAKFNLTGIGWAQKGSAAGVTRACGHRAETGPGEDAAKRRHQDRHSRR